MPGMSMPSDDSKKPQNKQASGMQDAKGNEMNTGESPEDFVQEIEHHATSGTSAEPNGSPATQLALISMDGSGSGMMTTFLANGMTVTVSSSTAYSIDTRDADMHALPFVPTFDSTHIFAGQLVSTISSSGMMSGNGMMGGLTNSGSLTASSVELEPQGFNGTIANYTAGSGTATFNLTLPSNSVLATLTGSTSITVFQQIGPELRDLTSIANGSNVHVRGLLFYDSGTYKVVATRITATQ